MKTTKRSKMLLSSIAMLLVALVALGSASFAWYYTQTTVYANNAKFAAASATGLEISLDQSTWTTSVDLQDASASGLAPAATNWSATSADLIAGTGGTGTAYDDGALDSTLTYENAAALKADTGSFYYDECWVASSGSACDAYLKVTGTGADDTYMVILVYADGNLVGKYTSDTKTGAPTTSTKVKQDTGNTSNAIIDGAIGDVTGLKVLGEDKIATAITAKAKTAGGTHVEVLAYADGFNAKCKSSAVKTTGIEVDLAFKTSAWT